MLYTICNGHEDLALEVCDIILSGIDRKHAS